MQGPVPDQFNLVVTDMDATVAFYRKLGLTIPDTDPQWQHHHRTAALPGGIDLDLDSSEFAGTGTTAGGAAWGCSGSR
jgi:catechol 2,3-dioxygenase-like lactoylglutathione lyase family enzyme